MNNTRTDAVRWRAFIDNDEATSRITKSSMGYDSTLTPWPTDVTHSRADSERSVR